MSLTQSDKDKLARFVGLIPYLSISAEYISWLWATGEGWFCDYADWNPAENPAHGDLVLQKIAEWHDLEIEKFGPWWVGVWRKGSMETMADAHSEGNTLQEAVCQAALEIIKREQAK